MGVGIDEAWEDDGVAEINGGNIMRTRDGPIGTDRFDPSIGSCQESATFDRRAFNRNHPACGQPPPFHFRAGAEWALGLYLPSLLRCHRWLPSRHSEAADSALLDLEGWLLRH